MSLLVRLCVFYASLCFFSGIQLPFLPVWLHARGLSSQEISMIVAAAMFLRIAIGPLIASFADHWGNKRGVILGLAWGAMVAVSLLPLVTSFWPILFVCLLMLICWPAMTPIAEVLVMRARDTDGIVYGQVRLWCSITFIVASTGTGWLLEWNPPSIIAFCLIGSIVLNLAGAYLLPRDVTTHHSERAGGFNLSGIAQIARHPLFMLGLFTGAILQSSHSMFYAFGTLNWQRLGLGADVIGLLWGLGVVAEIILFAFSGPVMKRVTPMQLLMIAGIGGIIRWGAMAFDPPLWLLFPLQVLHAATFCAAHLGGIHFVSAAAPRRVAATAQSLYASLCAAMMGLMTLFVGQLYPHFASQAYLLPAALGFVGCIGALIVAARWKGGSLFGENEGEKKPALPVGGC